MSSNEVVVDSHQRVCHWNSKPPSRAVSQQSVRIGLEFDVVHHRRGHHPQHSREQAVPISDILHLAYRSKV